MTKAYLRKDLVEAGEIPPTTERYFRNVNWNTQLFTVHSLDAESHDGFNLLLSSPETGPFYACSIDFDFTK